MNNLVALSGMTAGLREQVGDSRVLCIAHEALQQVLFAATEDGRLVGVNAETCELVLEAPLPAPGVVIAVHALSELDAVFVATAEGALLLMHHGTQTWETVGEMESGLLAASCSPDGELLVCLTRSLTLLALSPSSWDVLSERKIESNLIDPASQPSFAWRADGHKCSMLARDSAGKSRVTVMDRACATEFVSEPFDKVGTAIAFHPDGSLIASSQKIANRHDIIFFEPNALRHYELTLPAEQTESTVKSISWSADGALLAVSLSGASADVVQVWHRANYHWYLKYEYMSHAQECKTQAWAPPCCLWHESDPLSAVFFVGSDDARVLSFTWEWFVSAPYLAAGAGERQRHGKDWSTSASIDGKRLLLTPLRNMVIPPPMCAAVLEVAAAIVSVCWGPSGKLAVLCSDGSLLICSPPFENQEWDKPPRVEAVMKVEGRLLQLAWPDGQVPHLLVAVTYLDGADRKPYIIPLHLPPITSNSGNSGEISGGTVVTKGVAMEVRTSMTGAVRLTREVGQGACVLLLPDGSIHSISSLAARGGSGGQVELKAAARLPAACVVVAALNGGTAWIGLSKRGKVWWASQQLHPPPSAPPPPPQQLADAVTSLAIHDGELLILTTALCRLQFYEIRGGMNGKDSCGGAPTLLSDDARMLERGAVLVAAPDEDQRLVLSMPRGNLEVLHPQLLVVRRTCALLSARNYLAALSLMRKHKVDMNVLVDYDPAAFFHATTSTRPAHSPAHPPPHPQPAADAAGGEGGAGVSVHVLPAAGCSLLLTQLGKEAAHLLSLFIASLRNDSVRDTLYPYLPPPPFDHAAAPPTPELAAFTAAVLARAGPPVSKVNAVCDLMCEALRASSGLPSPTVAAAEKTQTAALDTSLRACMVLTFVRRHPPRVQEALAYLQGADEHAVSESLQVLVGLVDPQQVWEEALGLYDLTLAASVAQIGGHDPREYVPLLQRLAALPDRHCCYEIDLLLKRYPRALMHAVRGGDGMWEHARQLMCKHALYAEAVQQLRSVERCCPGSRQEHLKDALALYGTHLGERGEHRLAGLVLKSAGLAREAAAEMVQDAASWETAMLLLHEEADTSDALLQRRAYDIAEALRLAGDSRAAARVYLDYCADVDEAVAALVEGREWVEAGRVARKSKRADLLPTTVITALSEAHVAMAHEVESRVERLAYIAARLSGIQADKDSARRAEERATGGGGGGETACDDDSVNDAASDWSRSQAPSASSHASRRSFASSRSAKSNKTRSSARIPKEGDPWEEEYLNKTRPPLVPTLAFRHALRRMLEALVLFGLVDQAAALQAKYGALEDYVEQHNLRVLALEPPPPAAGDYALPFLHVPAL